MTRSVSAGGVLGADYNQQRAREAAGLEIPRIFSRYTPKTVSPIVTAECPACGGTNAWPVDQRSKSCDYCGAKHTPVPYTPPEW